MSPPEPGPFDPAALPEVLPIFPLTGVLLLPGAELRLNIFEPRYLAMVDAALASARLIGMVQPRATGSSLIFDHGCAGRIVEFRETGDGRYLLTLLGVRRFRIAEEIGLARGGFRRVTPDWTAFCDQDQDAEEDEASGALLHDRARLLTVLRAYLEIHGLKVDWSMVEEAAPGALVNDLAIACPFEANEKQALLEAATPADRAGMLVALMEMAILSKGGDPAGTRQ